MKKSFFIALFIICQVVANAQIIVYKGDSNFSSNIIGNKFIQTIRLSQVILNLQ